MLAKKLQPASSARAPDKENLSNRVNIPIVESKLTRPADSVGISPSIAAAPIDHKTRDRTSIVRMSLDPNQTQSSFGVVNNIMAARKQQELHLQREQLKANRVDLKLPNS